jgi:hypothetical protein
LGKNHYHLGGKHLGRLILCSGEKAEHPWKVPEDDIRLYSIEELCYYIYNHIYSISEDFFTLELAEWIEKELRLPEVGQKLAGLVKNQNTCKDLVVTVLCGSDYYVETEIQRLLFQMDKLSNMSEAQRKKYKADQWLKQGEIIPAGMEYRNLLRSKKEGLTNKESGDIYHNLGITCLYTGTLEDAAKCFWEAYQKNGNKESLTAYLEAASMAGLKTENVPQETKERLLTEYEFSKEEYKKSSDYQRLMAATEEKEAGHTTAYYEEIDRLLKEWKREYKKKVG